MKFKKCLLAVLSLALVLGMTLSTFENLAPVTVQATSSSEIREEIDEVEKQREEIQKEMDSLSAQINANMTEIEKLVAEKNVIDQEIGLLNQEIQLINQQIQAYSMLIADKQDELDAAQARLDELTQQNKERIRAMEEDGNLSYWSVLFRANSFSDLLDRLNMIEEIASADSRRLEELRVARNQVETAQAELNQQKAELEQTRVELEEAQNLLAQKRVEADKKLAELNAKNQEYLDMLEAAEDADLVLMQQIAQLEKEYNDAKAAEDAANAPSGGGSSSTTPRSPAPTAGVSTRSTDIRNSMRALTWRTSPVLPFMPPAAVL